jgi:hypothetical protein
VLYYNGNLAGTWSPVSTPAPATGRITAIWGSGPTDIFLLADQGRVLVH